MFLTIYGVQKSQCDRSAGTLGERIRTLFKEQGITIVSILTALGMTLEVLIEALLGGPSVSSTTSESTTTVIKRVELVNG